MTEMCILAFEVVLGATLLLQTCTFTWKSCSVDLFLIKDDWIYSQFHF